MALVLCNTYNFLLIPGLALIIHCHLSSVYLPIEKDNSHTIHPSSRLEQSISSVQTACHTVFRKLWHLAMPQDSETSQPLTIKAESQHMGPNHHLHSPVLIETKVTSMLICLAKPATTTRAHLAIWLRIRRPIRGRQSPRPQIHVVQRSLMTTMTLRLHRKTQIKSMRPINKVL